MQLSKARKSPAASLHQVSSAQLAMQLTTLLAVLSSALAVLSSPTQVSNGTDIARLDLQTIAREHAPELDPLSVGTPLASDGTVEVCPNQPRNCKRRSY